MKSNNQISKESPTTENGDMRVTKKYLMGLGIPNWDRIKIKLSSIK